MWIAGRNPVMEALKNDRNIDVLYIKHGEAEGSIKKIIALARERKIRIKEVDKKKIEELAQGQLHQGVIAEVPDYRYHDLEQVLRSVREKGEEPFFIVLDEIEDPHNLGAIIRTAEGAGAHGVIIGKRRSASVNATVEKTSAGAISYLPVIRVGNIAQTIERLKKDNIWIYALDMEGSCSYETDLRGSIALLIGNEGKGISRLNKELADKVISLPMKGRISSLNASVAAGILMYEVLRQRGLSS